MRRLLLALLVALLLSCKGPQGVYSRAPVPDETPFDAVMRFDVVGSIEFRNVGALMVLGQHPERAELIQCLHCHRMVEHPPVKEQAYRFKWTEVKGTK